MWPCLGGIAIAIAAYMTDGTHRSQKRLSPHRDSARTSLQLGKRFVTGVAPGLQNQWWAEMSMVGSTPIRFRHDAKAPVSRGLFYRATRPCDISPPIPPDLHSPHARRQRVRHRPAETANPPRPHPGRPSSRPVMTSSTPHTLRPRPFRPPRADCALNVLLWLDLAVLGAAPVSALANEDARAPAGVAPSGAFVLLNTVYPPYSVALGDGGGAGCPSSTPLRRKQFRQAAHRPHGPVPEQRHGGRSLSVQPTRPGCRRGQGGPARAQLPAVMAFSRR